MTNLEPQIRNPPVPIVPFSLHSGIAVAANLHYGAYLILLTIPHACQRLTRSNKHR